MMRTVIRKPDLDTCLTALIIDVSDVDNVIVCREEAPMGYIRSPDVLCIEADGSGEVHLNNFDHHDPVRYFPPACRQAFEWKKPAEKLGVEDNRIDRLVEYVCMVDERHRDHPDVAFPSLSNVFSGMMLVETDALERFRCGLAMLRRVLSDDIDPFGSMPDIPAWRPYVEAKEKNYKQLAADLKNAEFYTARSRCCVALLQSENFGGLGALYERGAEVVINYNPAFGDPPVRKFTVSGNGKTVSHMLIIFNAMETGWGGRKTIIGSPGNGTSLDKDTVLAAVIENS